MRIAFAGMVAGDPHQGGATWAVLQYVLGLRRLGHEVFLVEPVDELTAAARSYFDSVVRDFDLDGRAALVHTATNETVGTSYADVAAALGSCDVLLNVSGMLAGEPYERVRGTRVFVDLDPAFNQLWHEAEGIDMGFDRHDAFVTVGLALGDPDCPVPTGGRTWIRTPQPVVLDLWPAAPPLPEAPVTSIGNFRGYGSVEWDGQFYGQRVHSLRSLVELPERVEDRLVLAMTVHPEERDDLAALDRHGWHLEDPEEVAGTPGAYAEFIAGSKAEIGIAKSGYVHSRCGWFSDRSACYLASGRPVVAQDTGYGRYLPTGDGLLAFSTVEEAAEALTRVRVDHSRHSRAARRIAEEVFDSNRVLPNLLGHLG